MYLLQEQPKYPGVGFLRQSVPSGSCRTVQKSGKVSLATSSQAVLADHQQGNSCAELCPVTLKPSGCAAIAADTHPLMAGICLVLVGNHTGKVPERESWKTMDLNTGKSQAQTELFLFLHCAVGERKRKLLSP